MTHEPVDSTQQAAGDSATQIGSVSGNVIQNIHQRHGFWTWLTASVITLGVLLCTAIVVDKLWPAGDQEARARPGGDPGGFAQGGPAPGASSAVPDWGAEISSAAAPWGAADFRTGVPVQYQPGAAPPGAGASFALPPAASQAQLLEVGAQVMGLVNSVETQALATRDLQLASTMFAGTALQNLQARIVELTSLGCFEHAQLEAGQVLAVRLLGSDGFTTRVQIDTCETWSSATNDAFGQLVASQPRHVVPQTVTIDMSGGQVKVTAIDFMVSFPGCP